MSEILETVMLICFGFSWPMSVIKNYKARTAKGMSLGFILLIIFGYLAGISAKIMMGSINYVLVVYLLNLVMVSGNLIVYFRNRHLDNLSVATVPAKATLVQESVKVLKNVSTIQSVGGVKSAESDGKKSFAV